MVRGIIVGLAVAVAAVIGYGVGNSVLRPQVESLEEARAGQTQEIVALQTRVRDGQARVEALLVQIGDAGVDRTGLQARLDTATASLAEATEAADASSAAQSAVQASLDASLATILELRSSLDAAEAQGVDLADRLREAEASQETIGATLKLQAELLAVIGDELNPNLGDGSLLAEQGSRAALNLIYDAAAAYFSASSEAFGVAKEQAEDAAFRSKSLSVIVPERLRAPFATTHKQSEATARAAGAQELEYQAAASMYTIIDEWVEAEAVGSNEQIAAWTESANGADDRLEQALALLDEADEWAPDLWRQYEAIRIQIRDQQDLLASIRFIILEEF